MHTTCNYSILYFNMQGNKEIYPRVNFWFQISQLSRMESFEECNSASVTLEDKNHNEASSEGDEEADCSAGKKTFAHKSKGKITTVVVRPNLCSCKISKSTQDLNIQDLLLKLKAIQGRAH